MLSAEDDAKRYFPIGPVSTIGEVHEIAQEDMRTRMLELDRGGEPYFPTVYKVWAHLVEGYAVAGAFNPSQL
jgi:hypothetical protein